MSNYVVLEKTLESPLDCKEIQPVHSKDQSWVFFGRNDVKAETPVLWPPHAKSWLIGKDSDAGRDWGQEEGETTEDEMAECHHWLDGHESEWTPGVGDGQGGLACCDSWDHEESYTTDRLNWTELKPTNRPIEWLYSLCGQFYIHATEINSAKRTHYFFMDIDWKLLVKWSYHLYHKAWNIPFLYIISDESKCSVPSSFMW